jgi:hypothetical protein
MNIPAGSAIFGRQLQTAELQMKLASISHPEDQPGLHSCRLAWFKGPEF